MLGFHETEEVLQIQLDEAMRCEALNVPCHCRSRSIAYEFLEIWILRIFCEVYPCPNRGISIPNICHWTQHIPGDTREKSLPALRTLDVVSGTRASQVLGLCML